MPGRAGNNSKDVRVTRQVVSDLAGGKPRGPTDQKWDVAGGFEVALLLPAVMVAQVVAVVGKEADHGVLRIAALFDGIQNAANAESM